MNQDDSQTVMKSINDIIANPVHTLDLEPLKQVKKNNGPSKSITNTPYQDTLCSSSPKTIDLSFEDYTNKSIIHGKSNTLLERQRHGIAMGISRSALDSY